MELEDGVQIEFDGGTFAVGDYWLIPARTLTGRVEWPRTGTATSVFEAPHGTVHHYARARRRVVHRHRLRPGGHRLPQAVPAAHRDYRERRFVRPLATAAT